MTLSDFEAIKFKSIFCKILCKMFFIILCKIHSIILSFSTGLLVRSAVVPNERYFFVILSLSSTFLMLILLYIINFSMKYFLTRYKANEYFVPGISNNVGIKSNIFEKIK